MKVVHVTPAAGPSLADAAAELALRMSRLEGTELVLALERRLRPEEADELAGRPKGWAGREARAGRLEYEKDPGGEREGRGRVGAMRIPVKTLLAALEARRVEASRPAARRYVRRPGALASLRAQEIAS
ncbi:MAG TPA: hypothetical protein DCQ64_09485 [Candidatus Rokubacteria bacterium]|nr:hypothetical protein [Candidatus Rokubacteria bacterium]